MTKRTGVVYGIATYKFEQDQYLVLFEGEKKAEWVSSSSVELVD